MSSEHEKQKFETQLGQGATVQRSEESSELFTQCNLVLTDLGEELKPVKEAEYLGSFAVHCYQTPKLRQMFFVSQTQPKPGCTPLLASKALTDLTHRAKESFGFKVGTKRSGW